MAQTVLESHKRQDGIPFEPKGFIEPGSARFVIQVEPHVQHVISGVRQTQVLTFLARHPEVQVPRDEISEFLRDIEAAPISTVVNNLQKVVSPEVISTNTRGKNKFVTSIGLHPNVRRTLSASLESKPDPVNRGPEIPADLKPLPEGQYTVLLTPYRRYRQGGRSDVGTVIVVEDEAYSQYIPGVPARYLQMLGKLGSKGASRRRLVRELGSTRRKTSLPENAMSDANARLAKGGVPLVVARYTTFDRRHTTHRLELTDRLITAQLGQTVWHRQSL